MYKYGLVLVFLSLAVGLSAQTPLKLPKKIAEDQVKDSTYLHVSATTPLATFKLGGNFYRGDKWHLFKRDVYPIEIHARYRSTIYDTMNLDTRAPGLKIKYRMPYTPMARYYTNKMTVFSVPMGVTAIVSARQYGWLIRERRDLNALAEEIETSIFTSDLEAQFNDKLPAYRRQRAVLWGSNAVFLWSTYRFLKWRKERRTLRVDTPKPIASNSLQLLPFYQPNSYACGTSLVFSF